MADLEGLKKVLRSLVVSSPTTMDAASLLRDYRQMVGKPLPSAQHGFRDPVQFLRERCSDCFLFSGPQNNPILTLIVTNSIKHIDQFVQSQKSSKLARGKRRSVPESKLRIPNGRPITTPNRGYIEREPPTVPRKPEPIVQYTEPKKPEPAPQPVRKPVRSTPTSNAKTVESECSDTPSAKVETLSNGHSDHEEGDSQQRLQRFYKKRMLMYQSQKLGSQESLRDDDSGRQTSSSVSSRSAAAAAAWAQLQAEVVRLVARRPSGLWCNDLLRLYEEEYGTELNFARFRYPSVSACACAVEGLRAQRAADGDWLLTLQGGQEGSTRSSAALRLRRAPRARSLGAAAHASQALLDADDALPGIDYDPDVFPPDCLSFLDSIPAGSLAGVAPGDMLPVLVAEVYSPSHLWLQRQGPDHDLMQEYMDQMTKYYSTEGRDRVLAGGARRPGQYCSSVFEGDWHRSLIVQVVDSDTVKVRHVDYGTVDAVAAGSLRPLRRQWGALPAQAVRARLAGLRPAAASRRWPRAAAAYCLDLVRERPLVANVVSVDHEECILEVLLIDTNTEEDVSVSELMIRAGHADARPHSALAARDGYLLPSFRALETGLTPNYSEIHALLRDGIALDFVPAYRAHVASLLPGSSDDSGDPEDGAEPPGGAAPPGGASPPQGASPPPLAANRVPMALSLLRLAPSAVELLHLSPDPSPVPDSSPALSPREHSPELDSPLPEIQERCMTPVSPAPAPAPAKACCARSGGPSPARAPHPASCYALPPCPCSQPYKPQVQVPVSVPLIRHYPAGYFRPRVSPQHYYPQFRPPVTMNYYGQPVFHQAHQNFPVAQQHPQNFLPNSAQNPPQFVPNSMQHFQQFVPSSTQNFKPHPGPNPQGPPNFGPGPVPNSPNYGPGPGAPGPNTPNFGPSPVPNSSNVGPALNRPNTNASSPNLQLAASAPNGPQPANFGPERLRGSTNSLNGEGSSVRLSGEECEIFELLSRVDPGAAHRYMIAALRRARGGPERAPGLGAGPERPPAATSLNPHAAVFRTVSECRPPPGFENCTK